MCLRAVLDLGTQQKRLGNNSIHAEVEVGEQQPRRLQARFVNHMNGSVADQYVPGHMSPVRIELPVESADRVTGRYHGVARRRRRYETWSGPRPGARGHLKTGSRLLGRVGCCTANVI